MTSLEQLTGTMGTQDAPLPTESAEQAILGAILTDKEAWDFVADKIDVNHFLVANNRKVFMAMKSLACKQGDIDIVTLENELRELKLWEGGEAIAYVGQLAFCSLGSANLNAYVSHLLMHGTRRRLNEIASKIPEITAKPIEPSEMVDEIDGLVLEVQLTSVRGGGPIPISIALKEVLDNIDKPDTQTISTGFIMLDQIMDGGMRPGELIIVAGRPGMGKTTLGMNIATQVACELNKGVLIFSMEMTATGLAERIFASLAQIDLSRLRQKRIDDYDYVRLGNAIQKLSNNNIRIDPTPRLKPSEIRSRARRDMREYKNLSLILVDYVQLMRSDRHYENKANEVAECSGALKALAKELNIPIIALAQLNRNSVIRDAKRPTMSDLKDSGSIEQDADMVMLIHREEVYNKETENRGLATIIVDKQRNGQTGDITLSFDGAHNRFLNYKDFTV